MIGNVIEQQFVVAGNWNFGSALSVVLMLMIIACITFTSKYEVQAEGGGLF